MSLQSILEAPIPLYAAALILFSIILLTYRVHRRLMIYRFHGQMEDLSEKALIAKTIFYCPKYVTKMEPSNNMVGFIHCGACKSTYEVQRIDSGNFNLKPIRRSEI